MMPIFDLSTLRAGADVLIDANILIYAVTGSSQESYHFLSRCADEEVRGYTTAEVVNDACHHLMLIEAVQKGAIPREAANLLKKRPGVILSLTDYWVQVEAIVNSNVAIMPLDETRILHAEELQGGRSEISESVPKPCATDVRWVRPIPHRGDRR